MKILLIAGHGNGDPGACACGLKEADLTREVAAALLPKLKTYADVDLFDTSKNMYAILQIMIMSSKSTSTQQQPTPQETARPRARKFLYIPQRAAQASKKLF